MRRINKYSQFFMAFVVMNDFILLRHYLSSFIIFEKRKKEKKAVIR